MPFLYPVGAAVAISCRVDELPSWWQLTSCWECDEVSAMLCSGCFAPICCKHRVLGSCKPKDWPEHRGGLHVFCKDKKMCFKRWKMIGSLARELRAV